MGTVLLYYTTTLLLYYYTTRIPVYQCPGKQSVWNFLPSASPWNLKLSKSAKWRLGAGMSPCLWSLSSTSISTLSTMWGGRSSLRGRSTANPSSTSSNSSSTLSSTSSTTSWGRWTLRGRSTGFTRITHRASSFHGYSTTISIWMILREIISVITILSRSPYAQLSSHLHPSVWIEI